MLEQTWKVVELSGSAGKEADIDPQYWKITAGAADTSAACLGKAPGRTIPTGAGLRASTTHPFASGDCSRFVVGCYDDQGEAAEPLMPLLPTMGDRTSDRHLTLEEEELEVSIGLMNWSDVSDLCISDGKSSSKATLDRMQPPVELCPILDQKSCGALSQVVDEHTLFGVLCSPQEGGELSVKPCLPLVQGATYSSPCPSMDESSSPDVLPVLPVCHSLEERAFSRLKCSPMEQGVPPVVMCPLMEKRASSPALGLSLSLNPVATSTLFHPYSETEPSAVPCPTRHQRTMAAVLYPSLEARVLTGDQCRYPEEHRLSDGHSSPLHHRDACPATNTFLAAHMEESPDQQTAGASVFSVEDEEADHQEECPICTEQYDTDRCRQALLNCQHVVCDNCVKAIMDQGGQADIGRVRCPICRQKTPMMKWEILKLQETMLEQDCARLQTVQAPFTAASRRPGLWGALEYNFQQRFRTSRTFSCIPCLRYPLCFIERLNELERRNRCCYLFTLLLLYFAEKLCFVLPFLPILMLVLIITLDTHT